MPPSTGQHILIVDDTPANLKVLCDTLEAEGYEIIGVPNGKTALRIALSEIPELIILDIMMPGMDGYEVCRRLKQNEITAHIPVIFITVKEDKKSLIQGFTVGGVDYITKPFEKEEVLIRVKTHVETSRLTRELLRKNKELQDEIERREQAEDTLHHFSQREASRWRIEDFVGKSKTIAKILNDIRRFQETGTTSVLITGESGTGKELIARAIHFGGVRAKGAFIPVNCSTIPSELAESTLFGHVKGAFTGADAKRKGYFELAHRGTLFLDEISDMPLQLQVKLLRVIEDGCIMPVGGDREKHVDVRILAATNQHLQSKIVQRTFRNDLYFRLARSIVTVPPLRERREDIPLLTEHFLSMFAEEMGIENPVLSPKALSMLEAYHFPGNVRELKNIIESALIQNDTSEIRPEHLNFVDLSAPHTSHIETLLTDEEEILAYVKRNGSINNPQCRNFLSIDLHRASYLLKKMHRDGLLKREGEHRWSRYSLS